MNIWKNKYHYVFVREKNNEKNNASNGIIYYLKDTHEYVHLN